MSPRLAKVIPLAPREDIVGELEYMMEAAKRGEIVAFGYAALSAKNKTITNFVGAGFRLVNLIGATEILKSRLLRAWDEL